MKKILFAVAIILYVVSAFADEKYDALLKRIEQLEAQQEELIFQNADKRTQVNSFLNDQLTIGGFFEPAFTANKGPDTRFQAMTNSNILGINFAADFSPKLRFVSQVLTGLSYPTQNPNNDPRSVTLGQSKTRTFGNPIFGALVTQGYVEYTKSDLIKIQGGTGYVPFGYAFQQREVVLFVRRGGPQLIRTNTLASPLWAGVHLYGNLNKGKNEWGYNLYTTNPTDTPKMLGAGGRLWWSTDNDKLTAGVSSQVAKDNNHTDEVYGADVRYNLHPFIITSEFATHNTEGTNPWAIYLEPSFYIYKDEVLLFTFADFMEASKNTTVGAGQTLDDAYRKWEYGAGLNWLPTSYTRLRLSVTYNEYVGSRASMSGIDRDYVSVDLSAGVAF